MQNARTPAESPYAREMRHKSIRRSQRAVEREDIKRERAEDLKAAAEAKRARRAERNQRVAYGQFRYPL